MESTKDDSPLKARFLAVRKEIYNRYTDKQQTEQEAASPALKRGMSERERESEVIEIDSGDASSDALQLLQLLQRCCACRPRIRGRETQRQTIVY